MVMQYENEKMIVLVKSYHTKDHKDGNNAM